MSIMIPFPYVGAIVRFVDARHPQHFAAIVTHVFEDMDHVNLWVWAPNGSQFKADNIPFDGDAEPKVHTWHWREE